MKNQNKQNKNKRTSTIMLAIYRMFGIKKERNILEEEKVTSPTVNVVKNFFRTPTGVIGLLLFIGMLLFVVIGQARTEFDPYYSQPVIKNIPPGFGYLKYPEELKNEKIVDIQSGITFSVALTEDGEIYLWGKDVNGVLSIPEDIQETIDKEKVKLIGVGDKHIIVATRENTLLGWGNNEFDQTTFSRATLRKVKKEGVKKLGASDQISMLLTEKNNLLVWGSVRNNKLGNVPSRADDKVIDFTGSASNIVMIYENNILDYYGARGKQITEMFPQEYRYPTRDELKEGRTEEDVKTSKGVAITNYAGVLIDENDELLVWGDNIYGGLNLPEIDEPITKVVAGREHFLALGESGRIYAWGSDNYNVVSGAPDGEGYTNIFSTFFQNYAIKEDGSIKTWGNKGFLIGTDESGRDLMIRLIHGGKITMLIAAVSVAISMFIGIVIGMISGFYGGIIDNILMRFTEIVSSFPFLPLVITLSAILPVDTPQNTRLMLIMVILGVLGWTGIARLVRGQILAEREKDYILAANALGLKERKIIVSHILPNIISIVIVELTIGYAVNLLQEAGLSFLGFGVKAPFPSWGNMMTNAQASEVIRRYWWRWIYPAICVFLTALSVNLIGDALRDALDPKANER
ncbi:MAG: ABC transporter permease subunit [Saccharofermentanales bacterium]|jgi:peptide/nickel transport system permease protein